MGNEKPFRFVQDKGHSAQALTPFSTPVPEWIDRSPDRIGLPIIHRSKHPRPSSSGLPRTPVVVVVIPSLTTYIYTHNTPTADPIHTQDGDHQHLQEAEVRRGRRLLRRAQRGMQMYLQPGRPGACPSLSSPSSSYPLINQPNQPTNQNTAPDARAGRGRVRGRGGARGAAPHGDHHPRDAHAERAGREGPAHPRAHHRHPEAVRAACCWLGVVVLMEHGLSGVGGPGPIDRSSRVCVWVMVA